MNVRRVQTFNPGELPLVLLALARERPLRAYEFIDELDRLFGPAYRPSPGGVYPALKGLADEDLLSVSETHRARTYSITRSGREALAGRSRQLAAVQARTGVWLDSAPSVAGMLARFDARVELQVGRVDPVLIERVLERAATDIERLGDRDE